MRYNSESLEIKDLRSRNDVLYKDIKISLGLLITARKQHAEYRGNRNFGLSTTVNNRIILKILLPSAILRSKLFVSVVAALILGIFRRWALLAVFENFLENTESCEPKKYTTFIDSL